MSNLFDEPCTSRSQAVQRLRARLLDAAIHVDRDLDMYLMERGNEVISALAERNAAQAECDKLKSEVEKLQAQLAEAKQSWSEDLRERAEAWLSSPHSYYENDRPLIRYLLASWPRPAFTPEEVEAAKNMRAVFKEGSEFRTVSAAILRHVDGGTADVVAKQHEFTEDEIMASEFAKSDRQAAWNSQHAWSTDLWGMQHPQEAGLLISAALRCIDRTTAAAVESFIADSVPNGTAQPTADVTTGKE